MTIISHKHKFIFLKSRKTAGTSVETFLASYCGKKDILALSSDVVRETDLRCQNIKIPYKNWGTLILKIQAYRLLKKPKRIKNWGLLPCFRQHMVAAEVREAVGEKIWNEYYKFTIERNPYDYLVSLYLWRKHFFKLEDSFEDYIHPILDRALQNTENLKIDHDLNRSFYTINGRVCIDKIIHYEKLEDNLKEVLYTIGIKTKHIELPRIKSDVRKSKNYKDWYSSDLAEKAKKVFELEKHLFGYDFAETS